MKVTETQFLISVEIIKCLYHIFFCLPIAIFFSPEAGHDHLNIESSEKKQIEGIETQIICRD
jgi:hypothetical protein